LDEDINTFTFKRAKMNKQGSSEGDIMRDLLGRNKSSNYNT